MDLLKTLEFPLAFTLRRRHYSLIFPLAKTMETLKRMVLSQWALLGTSTCDRYELDCCTNVLSIGKTSKCSFFHWQSLFDARPFLARNWNRQRDSWQGFLEAVTQQPSRAAKFMKNKNDQLNSAAGFSTPKWTSLLLKMQPRNEWLSCGSRFVQGSEPP